MKRKTIGKRVLSISMAAVMVVSLSACGGKNGEQEEAIAASKGSMGAYKDTLICNMGIRNFQREIHTKIMHIRDI